MSIALAYLLPLLFAAPQAEPEPLRVFLRAGPKTHGPGEHDHPRFLAEWSVLLSERGADVAGGMDFPSEGQLARTDVLVLYAAEGASIHGEERANLEAYLARGGGIVVVHDAVCGDDSQWFKETVGGAWEHGHSKWHEGEVGYYFAAAEHPITKGIPHFDIEDEIYHELHMSADANVLASSFHTPFDVVPQMWTYEKGAYRAFVTLFGHEYATFAHPAARAILLRGIAWAGKREADLLVSPSELAELRYPPGGPLHPDVAHEALELHPDFELSLVAAEPLVVNPISLDWDPRGRMWVACTPGYPYKEEFSGIAPHDEIVILEDADRDGRMDARRTFHAGLDLVTSLVFHDDGVIVTQAPDILFLRDTDGDDRADVVETLFTGFGYSDTHATISNLRWGMDGWIYGTQGYSGSQSQHVIGKDGTDHGRIPNGIFRFRPDGSAIECVSAYGSNTWGLDFDWDGELFFTMANGSHLRHVVLDEETLARGRLGRVASWNDVVDHRKAFPLVQHDRAPYKQIDFVGGFTAAAGALVYNGGAWPDEYTGDHFVCEPTIHIVHRDDLAPNGVTYHATKPREAEFLAGRDLWFRPVHLRTGPDGAVYVLDFYNQASVHNDTRGPKHGPTNAAVRPDRDRLHGRIWRMQHKSAEVLSSASFETDSDCLAALEHPGRWQRMTAHREMRQRPSAISNVVEYMVDGDEVSKVHALWLTNSRPVIEAALRDESSAVRKNAARRLTALGPEQTEAGQPVIATWPTQLLDDENARVRLAALVGLQSKNMMTFEPIARMVDLYPTLQDDWSRSAVLGAMLQDPHVSLVMLAVGARGDAYQGLAGKLALGAIREDRVDGVFLRAIARDGAEVSLVEAVLSQLSSEWVPSSGHAADDGLIEALTSLLSSERPVSVVVATLPLAQRFPSDALPEALDEAIEAAGVRLVETLDSDADSEARLGCLQALLSLPAVESRAAQAAAVMLDPSNPAELQLATVRALGDSKVDAAAEVLVASWTRLSSDAREAAFDALARRAGWAARLLDVVESGDISRADLGPGRTFKLRHHPDASVAARAARLLAESNPEKDQLIAQFLPIVQQPGGIDHGREVFKENCANCHSLNGAGGNVGPDLTGMGAHEAAELLPFVLDPNRSVEPNYVEYVAKTFDGEIFGGVLARDGRDSILLRGSAGEFEVRREDIEELTSTGRSPMPTGFEELGELALRDLFAYLREGYEDYRVVSLDGLCTTSTEADLYDAREPVTYQFTRYGVHDVEGVPFEVLDPKRAANGENALVLKGAMHASWASSQLAQRVEVPVGFPVRKMYVLGGVAAWGFPFTDERAPAVRWTWHYADGGTEELILEDGNQFADWIRPHEVPGSTLVEGLLIPGSRGQLRTFTVAPARRGVVTKISLESFDNHLAPTFLALTAQVGEAPPELPPLIPKLLIAGGGSSHDFRAHFADTLAESLIETIHPIVYSENMQTLSDFGEELDVLLLGNNQALPKVSREFVFEHLNRGRGLVLVHASTWYNWEDWPEYNRELVGGGSRSHEAYGTFDVEILDSEHSVTRRLDETFEITDELYRFEPDPGTEIEVLAQGRSRVSGEVYPVIWTVPHSEGRIVVTTLGHDGAAHGHPMFRRLMRAAVRWGSGG